MEVVLTFEVCSSRGIFLAIIMIHDMLFPLGNNIHFYDHFSDEDKSIETLLQESMDFIQEKFTNDETVKNVLISKLQLVNQKLKEPKPPPPPPAAPPPPPPPPPPTPPLKRSNTISKVTLKQTGNSSNVEVRLKPKADPMVDMMSQLQNRLKNRQNRASLKRKYSGLK